MDTSHSKFPITSMAFPLLLFFLPYLLSVPSTAFDLTGNYYDKSCPKFSDIMQQVVIDKQLESPTTAAAMLRIYFHDCMVGGCDASILVTSNAFNKAERDADINLSLPGDGFDIITRAKTALELQCPGVVSCSDIMAVATRNLVKMVGGPFYNVLLGRKDGLESNASRTDGQYARPTMSMSQIISIFSAKGFSVQEMVALVGAHTIGFSHCKEFSSRLFRYSKTSETDPSYNPKFAQGLRKLCANYTTDPDLAAFNDVMTPGKFDNMYYRNLQRGLGLLASDQAMATDSRTKPFVDLYATNETAFFNAFAKVMEKVSTYNVKTGRRGEVRNRCDQFNTINA